MPSSDGYQNIVGQGFHTHPERINLEGRPIGARSKSTIYLEHLQRKGKDGQRVDDLVEAHIERALEGDNASINACLDAAYGKNPDILPQQPKSQEEMDLMADYQEMFKGISPEVKELILKNLESCRAKRLTNE